jgi:hypothetical protein
MRGILGLALLFGACDSGTIDVTKQEDLSISDLGLGNLDSTIPDLFMCGQRRDTGLESKSVVNSAILPMDRTQFAIDLNGDGKTDNQLGSILGALSAVGQQPQLPLEAAIQNGSDLLLIDVAASDFGADPCAAAQAVYANAQANPDFSGSGHFTVASSPAPVIFPGPIGKSGFSTSAAGEPLELQVLLPFATALVPVTLVDAHLSLTLSADGTATLGQINGAVRQGDVNGTLIPEAARQFNEQAASGPVDGGSPSSGNIQLLQIFDIGCSEPGARNFDGTPAAAHDGKIATCEVAENSIIANVLSPDVQLFDGSGKFAPNPDNTNKDSLSVGLGFTAVRATF